MIILILLSMLLLTSSLAFPLIISLVPNSSPNQMLLSVLLDSHDSQSVLALLGVGYTCSLSKCINVPASSCTTCTTNAPTAAVNLTTTLLVVTEENCGALDQGAFLFSYIASMTITAEEPVFASGLCMNVPIGYYVVTKYFPRNPNITGVISGQTLSIELFGDSCE